MIQVRSVERALNMLALISKSEDLLRLTEIAASLNLDKNTARRLLLTLENQRMVQRAPNSKKYGLGPGIWKISNARGNDLVSMCRPHMELLRWISKETVVLIVPREFERVVIDALNSRLELIVSATVGKTLPIYAGAAGKIFLAYMNETDRNKIIELTKLKPVLPDREVDIETYLNNLQEIRENGYVYSAGEIEVGVGALASPIFGADGSVVACIDIRAPEQRMTPEVLKNLAPLIVNSAMEISEDLGYQAS